MQSGKAVMVGAGALALGFTFAPVLRVGGLVVAGAFAFGGSYRGRQCGGNIYNRLPGR
jgi:hypothetical protein